MNTAEFDTRLRHQRRPERAEQPPLQARLQAVTTAPIAITVQTTDQELCEAIRAAAGNQHPVSIASSTEEAIQLAAEGRCGILITDQALTQNALVQIGKQMRAHDPATITIAVGSRGDDNALIGLLSSAVVERFMLKPVQASLARLVIRSAASEYQSLKYRTRREPVAPPPLEDVQSGEPMVVPMPQTRVGRRAEPTVEKPAPVVESTDETRIADALVVVEPRPAVAAATATPSRSGPAWQVWAVATAVALLVGAAVWWAMQSRIPDIDPRVVIATNLAAANQALEDGRHVDPPESSALHYYSVVLSLDADNIAARRGMDAVADRMMEDVKLAIVDGRLAEAGITLERLRRISSDHRRLALLDGELREEQANQISRLQSSVVAMPVTEPAKPAATVKKSAPRQKAPAVSESMIDTVEMSSADSVATLAAVRVPSSPLDMGPPVPVATAVEQPVAGAAVEADRPAMASAIVPPPVAAPVISKAPATPADPKLLQMVEPEFPQEARARNVEGWVDVTLAVTAAGEVASVRVNSAQNGRYFERAAIAAVKQWRYQPQPAADPAMTQPMRVRVSFKLQK